MPSLAPPGISQDDWPVIQLNRLCANYITNTAQLYHVPHRDQFYDQRAIVVY
jgi:hypothetical protein